LAMVHDSSADLLPERAISLVSLDIAN